MFYSQTQNTKQLRQHMIHKCDITLITSNKIWDLKFLMQENTFSRITATQTYPSPTSDSSSQGQLPNSPEALRINLTLVLKTKGLMRLNNHQAKLNTEKRQPLLYYQAYNSLIFTSSYMPLNRIGKKQNVQMDYTYVTSINGDGDGY